MNIPDRYNGVATLNHWVTALLVTAMWVLGRAASEAPDAAEDYIIGIHIALGFFVLWFVLWRIGYRVATRASRAQVPNTLQRTAARWMHRLLLLLLLTLVLSGPLYLFTEGESMDVFGWFTFYIPVPASHAVHEAIEEVHTFSGEWLLPLLLGLHILAAALHWLGRRDTSPSELQ